MWQNPTTLNPLDSQGNYSATSNNMQLEHWVISHFGLIFRLAFLWVLNWDWDQKSEIFRDQKVKSFFRLDSGIRRAFRWDQTSGWAIAESKAN